MYKTFKELGFKAGDTVVCTDAKRENFYKKGDKFTLKYANYGIRTDDEFGFDGRYGEWKLVEKEMDKFKIGDKVKIIGNINSSANMVGDIGTITDKHTLDNFWKVSVEGRKQEFNWTSECDMELMETKGEEMDKFKVGDKVRIIGNTQNHADGTCKVSVEGREQWGNWTEKCDMELVEAVEYENEWHLNDGKVEIPGDADKLEKDGSVVAFRYRKAKPFEFGDRVKSSGNGLVEYIFICYNWEDKNFCTVASSSGVYEYQPVHLFTRI